MSFTLPNGARRPIIDIGSENLMFVWNLPRWIDIGEIKRNLQPKYGRIKFVETFEAWRDGKRLGQIIVDFASSSSLSHFAKALADRDEFNYDGVEFMRFDSQIGHKPFFNFVRQQTGVDLLACGGVPPSFQYNQRKGPSYERESNPNNIPLGQRRGGGGFASPHDVNGRHDDNTGGRPNGVQTRASSFGSRGVGRGFGQRGSQFSGGSHRSQPQFGGSPSVPSDAPSDNNAGNGDHVSNRRPSIRNDAEENGGGGFGERGGRGFVLRGRGRFGTGNDTVTPERSSAADKGYSKQQNGEQHRPTVSPDGSFGSNPPSRNFTQRSSRPKPSVFDGNRFSVDADNNEKEANCVEGSATVLNAQRGVEENCPEDPEVDASFCFHGDDDGVGIDSLSVQQKLEEGEEVKVPSSVPAADGEEEKTTKLNGHQQHCVDSSFTQYRQKSRSREDSISESRDGHGGAGVKNTLKITQLDFDFDIAKILEALQTVGEVARFERLGKTSAAFTFDDAAEAANASVLVVGDLAAPNAYFQLMTSEEAYQ